MKKIVFLDRDGVINKKPEEHCYVTKPEELHILSGIVPALKYLKDLGYEFIIVTNQAGVGKGLISEDTLHKIHTKLRQHFMLNQIKILDIMCCKHRVEDACNCRKPKPGLILEAIQKHNVDIEKSFLIGDSNSDNIAATEANVRCLLIETDSIDLKDVMKFVEV